MIRKLWAGLVCLVLPGAMGLGFFSSMNLYDDSPPSMRNWAAPIFEHSPTSDFVFLAVFFIAILLGVMLFFKLKPTNIWILPIAFVLPAIACLIWDTLYPTASGDSGWGPYTSTLMVGLFYSLPFALLSLILAIRAVRQKRMEQM